MTKLSTSTSSISSSSSVGPHTQTPEAAQEVNGHLNETLGQRVPSGVVSEPLKPGLASDFSHAPAMSGVTGQVKPSTMLAFAALGFGSKPRSAPRYTHEAQAVLNAAERAPGLGSLMATAQRNQKRLMLLKGVVPPIILGQLSAGNLEQGVWCLMLKSPAAAGKLRQLVPAMCAHLRTKGELVHDITVKVIQHQG